MASHLTRLQDAVTAFERELSSIGADFASENTHFDATTWHSDRRAYCEDILSTFREILADAIEAEAVEEAGLNPQPSENDEHWTHTTSNGMRAA